MKKDPNYLSMLSPDQIRYLICLLGVYPFIWIYNKYLANNTYKHAFSIALSVIMCVFCFGKLAWMHTLVTATIVYCICKWVPLRPRDQTKWYCQPQMIVFLFSMLYMALCHIYRMYSDYLGWNADFTTVQMLNTIKFTWFAFCVADGYRKDKPAYAKENRFENAYYISELPCYLEWIGYVFFFPCFLVGPVVAFNDYQRFTQGRYFDDEFCKGKSPNTDRAALIVAGKAILCIPIFLIGQSWFNVMAITKPEFYQAWWVYKLVFLYICLLCIKCRYYIAWLFSESALIYSGIAYSGYNKEQNCISFNKGKNVNIMKLEFAQSYKVVADNWNICTARWLKDCVYKRLVSIGKPTWMAILGTNIVSAAWHGFYPGYFLSFVGAGTLTIVGRMIRKQVRPLFLNTKNRKIAYDVVGGMIVMVVLAYFALPFQVYTLELSLAAMGNLGFFGHKLIAITFISLWLASKLPKLRPVKIGKKE